MQSRIVSLAKKFIAVDSIPAKPKELERILAMAKKEMRGFFVEEFESNGSKSILVRNTKERPKKFKVILNGHLDVIPGKNHQYDPKIKGNRLYGVGSMDMKSSVACLISVFKKIANKVDFPMALQLVTDEQIGGFDGTKHQIEKGVLAEFVIAAEPTNLDIVNKAKGVLWLKIIAKGKTAHGAYPWKGENAVWKMNSFLNKLAKKYPNPKKEKWSTTVNLGMIKTENTTFNKIPDGCSVGLDIRYVPEETDTVLKDIRKILPPGFKLEVVVNEPPCSTDKNNEYIKRLQKTGEQIVGKKLSLRSAQGSSDARHYGKVNCSGIEFGPVGEGSGSDNEWVDITSLEKYCKILENFLTSIK